jgi:hypothetical protein
MRSGTKLHNGKEIPKNAKVFKSKAGLDCYIVGVDGDMATVKYIDTEEYKQIEFKIITKYL